MADDITIQIQESPPITISLNNDDDLLLSVSQACPLTAWSTIDGKPDFDSLYYSTTNPSGYVSASYISGLNFATQTSLSSTGQYLISLNSSTSGALRFSISVLESKTGSYYSNTNPSGFLTGAVVRPNTYQLLDSNALESLNWQTRQLSTDGLLSLGWADRILYDANEDQSLDWSSRQLVGAWAVTEEPTGSANLVNLAFLQSYAYPASNPSGFSTGSASGDFVLRSETGVYSGQFYPRSSNPSGYVTGAVIRPSDTGSFVTTSQTGQFYSSTNPSGYITGVNTGSLSSVFYPLQTNPSGYVTGSVVRPNDTGSFINTSQTGAFYATSNPSGYITSSSLTNYATQSYVNSASGVLRGDITILQAATGGYYSSSNPSGFVTGSVVRPTETGGFLTSTDLSSYATTGYVNSASGVIRSDISSLQTATGSLYPRTNPSGYITGVDTSSFVLSSQTGSYTGLFYPLSANPSGYVTGNVVRPTDTGAFLTSFQITGAGTVSSYVSGEFVVMSGAAGGGGITQGEADARYYPLITNPSGYVTGSVIRPTDTGSFVTTAQTGTLTGQFYPLTANPSSYVTGNVVRPNETGNFILTSQTGQFYASSNPSGYITGFNSGSYVLASQTGALTGAFYPLNSNPSGYVTGLVVRPTDTGSFITASQTGAFYAASNPSGYINSGDLSTYATQAYVNSASGVIRTDISLLQAGTGSYYLTSNPSGFVTGSVVRPTETGSFITTGFGATGYYPRLTNPSGYVTGSVIRASDTGDFYPRSNPSGHTGINQYRQLGPRAVPYATFSENVDKLLWGKASGDKPIFSTFNHATTGYVRNISGLGSDIDFTCCSVWNSDAAGEKAGTAITPRHIAFAYHFPIATGSTLRFVASDNQVVTRTLTGALRLGSTDLMIGGLDSDLPSSIIPALVLPSDYTSLLAPGPNSYTAAVYLNKTRDLSVVSMTTDTGIFGAISEPIYPPRADFYQTPIVGDSGGPVFLLAGNQPIFLGPLYSASAFTWASQNTTGVNSILSTLGGGYSLSFLDLRHYAQSEVMGHSFSMVSNYGHSSSIYTTSAGDALNIYNYGSSAIIAGSVSGVAMDIHSQQAEAIFANTTNSAVSIAKFGLSFQTQMEIQSNGSLYFTQESNTVSSSGKLLTGSSTVLDWRNLSLSEQWVHPSVATSSGHIANYHAVTGYSYPRGSNPSGYITTSQTGSFVTTAQTGALTGAFYPLATNPSGYITGSVVRPTETGAFLTSSQITGAGTVSSYLSGSVVVLSGAAGGGGLTQGQADALYYPLTGNPSGFATGSVVRPNETGAFLVTGAVSGAGSVSVSTLGSTLLISGSSSASAQTQAPRILGCVFDGGGSVLETGSKAYIRVSQSGTLYKYTALADITGSAIIDIYKNTYANYPPTSSSSITSGSKPTISTGIKTENSTLTGFSSVTFSSGDVFGINLDSCSGITRLTFELEYQP